MGTFRAQARLYVQELLEASPTYTPLEQHPVATRLLTAQPDSVLCRLAARGNIGAYDALYQRYRQPIFAFVFHLIGRPDATEDAEDIAQDAFTRAFASIREKSVDGSFRSWLYTIARNRTYDLMRAKKQNVVSLDADAAEPPAAPVGEEPAARAEQRAEFAWLMTAVAELPERQRDALLLREMGGFSHERIAEQLGTSVSATKKLISRGRDGIGEAAAADGYGRVARRRLGHDLAMAAPVLPITATLATLGIGAGAGSVAAGGAAIAGGKVAATALAVLAIGGGAVAVEHKATSQPPPTTAAEQQKLPPGGAEPIANAAPRGVVRGGRGDGERGRGRDNSGADDRGGRNGRGGREFEPGDDRSGGRSGSGRGERSDGRETESGGGRRGGSGDSGGSGDRSGPGGGIDDRPAEAEAPEPEPGDDHSGSGDSADDSGSESGSSNSGPGSDGAGEAGGG